LKFDPGSRPTASVLLSHDFFTKEVSSDHGSLTSLEELLQISSHWMKQAYLPVEYQGQSEKHIVRICEAISALLPTCEDWAKD